MNEIEKIQRYIDKTTVYERARYSMSYREGLALSQVCYIDAIGLAFKYGQAKGYRAAKTEERRKTAKKEDTTNVR